MIFEVTIFSRNILVFPSSTFRFFLPFLHPSSIDLWSVSDEVRAELASDFPLNHFLPIVGKSSYHWRKFFVS